MNANGVLAAFTFMYQNRPLPMRRGGMSLPLRPCLKPSDSNACTHSVPRSHYVSPDAPVQILHKKKLFYLGRNRSRSRRKPELLLSFDAPNHIVVAYLVVFGSNKHCWSVGVLSATNEASRSRRRWQNLNRRTPPNSIPLRSAGQRLSRAPSVSRLFNI